MDKNKKTQIIKISIVLAILVALILVYSNFYAEIKLLGDKIGGAERSIKILEEKRRDLDSAAIALGNLKSEVSLIESAFLSEESFVSFVNTLEGFGRSARVKFTAKEAKFPQSSSAPAEFSFSLNGEFGNIFKFLFLLDNSQYSGLLRKISVRRDGENSKNFIANIDYQIFNFRP